MDDNEARLLRAAPVLIGDSAPAGRMRHQILAALSANHIGMSGPEGAGQRMVALALHAGRTGPFVSVDGSTLYEDAVAAQWARAHGGTLFIARAQRLAPDALGAVVRAMASAVDDDVRVIWVGEVSAFMAQPAAHEISFYALEDRRSDVPQLIEAFIADAARDRRRAPPGIDDDVWAAIEASSVEDLAEQCRAIYERFVQSEEPSARISIANVRAAMSSADARSYSPGAGDRTAELKRLAAQLSALDLGIGFDELHAHLCADAWLASLPREDRREVLADLAMQFYSRSNRDPRYEAVLALFMLDVLDAHPGATRDEMLAEVKDAGLTGASTNFLSKHVLARWPGMEDFSDLQAKARRLAWGRSLPALDDGRPPAQENIPTSTTLDLAAPRPFAADVTTAPAITDDVGPLAGPEAYSSIEIPRPTIRWSFALRTLVISTVVAVGAMLLVGRLRPPPAGHPALPIAMGADHLCAWTGTDAPRCWYGDSHPCRTLMPGSKIRVPGRAQQMVAGGAHTCVATHRGDAWCWGGHRRGQLGVPAASATPCTQPRLIWRGDVVRIAAHGDRTCVGVRHSGIWCLGDNRDGVLPTTATVAPAVRVASIAAIADLIMLRHAVCWRESELIRCRHAAGEEAVSIPASTSRVAGAGDLLCTRTSSGEVRCWRLSDDGRFITVDVVGAADVVMLRMGRRCEGEDSCRPRVCVADANDRVFCGESWLGGVEGASVLRLEETDLFPDAMGVGGKADCGLIDRNPHCWPPTPGYPSAIEVETIGGP